MRIQIITAIFIFCSPVSLAQNLRSPDFLSQAQIGFQAMYNLSYDLARERFKALKLDYPEHPAPPLYQAILIWQEELFQRQDLRLDRFIAPGYFAESAEKKMDPEMRRAFFNLIEESQQLCQSILRKKPRHFDARYFFGVTEGILASFAITIDHDKSEAFSHGKNAYKYHREIIDENPDYYDAYLSVGLYEYIVDNLPWYIKWLAAIVGYRGSEERGFKYIEIAGEKSKFIGDNARLIQVVLFVREKRYQDALEIARLLHEHYPQNPLLHLNRAQILEKMNKEKEAVQQYKEVLERAEAGKSNYDKLRLSELRFRLANQFFGLKRWEFAKELFHRVVEDAESRTEEKVRSYLKLGQIYDLQGKRTVALGHYRKVLKFKSDEEVRDQAKEYLDNPYDPG